MGTFDGYDIARSGMMTYNAMMQTSAHNLANIGTKGYSRQQAIVTAHTRNVSSIKIQGAGSYVQDVVRQRNEYFDTKYQGSNSTYNMYASKSYYLNEVQTHLYAADEGDGGITTSFDAFCKALNATIDDAGSETHRKEVVTYAETFTEFVTETATQLRALQDEANEELKTCVNQINALAEKIAALTKQINTLEVYGNTANDLRDQRTVLVDDLSQYCNIEVNEVEPADGVGMNQYYIYANGGVLVDTENVNRLVCTELETTKNINDIEGLYKITREDGTPFDEYNIALGGKLQALFEVRDGNNANPLQGKASTLTDGTDGNLILTMVETNVEDVRQLNIPAEDGELTINGFTYYYNEFSVDVAADGSYTYTFSLKNNIKVAQADILKKAVARGEQVTVGDVVDYKGIPYYMAQLNEFVRTYAQEFNDIQKEGFDSEGNPGIDFFNATTKATGENYYFEDKTGEPASSFDSLAKAGADGTYKGSYYYMTALNFTVTEKVQDNPMLLACNGIAESGESENLNLQRLYNLKDNSKMFLHGAPDSFLQTLTADVAVDARKAMTLEGSQKNIRDAVEIQRQSVSGADEDEETQDLVTFQQLLFNQYKVLSVMNEVINKLINDTAV